MVKKPKNTAASRRPKSKKKKDRKPRPRKADILQRFRHAVTRQVWLSKPEVAARFGVHPRTIDRWSEGSAAFPKPKFPGGDHGWPMWLAAELDAFDRTLTVPVKPQQDIAVTARLDRLTD